MKVIGIPDSNDTDIYGTGMAVGVDTALNAIMEAVELMFEGKTDAMVGLKSMGVVDVPLEQVVTQDRQPPRGTTKWQGCWRGNRLNSIFLL